MPHQVVKESRKLTLDACYWVNHEIVFTFYSKDVVFSLDNDHDIFMNEIVTETLIFLCFLTSLCKLYDF